MKPAIIRKTVTQHLSSAQKNEVLLSGDAGEFGEHLQQCEECRADIAALKALLGCFGEAVVSRGAALQQELQQRRHAPYSKSSAAIQSGPRARRTPALFKPVFAAAMLLALAVLWFVAGPNRSTFRSATIAGESPRSESTTAQTRHVEPAPMTDELLMKQIAEQLDQHVPTSMLPLTAMVTNEVNQAAGPKRKEN